MTDKSKTQYSFPKRQLILWVLTSSSALACSSTSSDEDEFSPLSEPGGATTFFDRTGSAYQNPASNLSDKEFDEHLEGDVTFEATFVSAPAEVNPGLGPLFNNDSCATCHVRNGRGRAVAGNGPLKSHLLVRTSIDEGEGEYPGSPPPHPLFGSQIQDHALYGESPEATVSIEWTEEPGEYPADGEGYSLRRPHLKVTMPDGSPMPGDVLVSMRIPPPVFGLGLLELIPEEALKDLADPNDEDDDGISGRLNEVYSVLEERMMPGRFGWKANQPTLVDQAAAAYSDDMGVSNPLHPGDDEEPDITMETVESAAFYTQTLAVPARGEEGSAAVREGDKLFRQIGCASCHTPELKTGESDIDALSEQIIRPYTDLLLHQMGFDLADSRPDYLASGTEWRTAPLWGIGVVERVLGTGGFLHDGRARTLEEAILWHGGEAESSRDAFLQMNASERHDLIEFLYSL